MTAALIISHGQPSAPDKPEADMGALAVEVARHAPGIRVASATLAGGETVGRALAGLGAESVDVYPLFMADGWFVTNLLPRRLAKAWSGEVRILPPFGLDPAVPALCMTAVLDGATRAGLDPAETHLLLAAHGSPSDPRPAAAARHVEGYLSERHAFRAVSSGFVDEAPYLAAAGRVTGPAICLPFFAAANGHVNEDLPDALAEAAFPGCILPPVGTRPEVPELIAAALTRAARARAA